MGLAVHPKRVFHELFARLDGIGPSHPCRYDKRISIVPRLGERDSGPCFLRFRGTLNPNPGQRGMQNVTTSVSLSRRP